MKTLELMLRSHPRADQQHAGMYAETLHALTICAQICTACADACLAESEELRLRRCIRTNLDCGGICAAASALLIRQTETPSAIVHAVLHTCVIACQACSEECELHAEMHDYCRICADACRHCQERCNFLLGAISSAGTAEDASPLDSPTLSH